ncbi:MAG TPA: helix-turn-helix domain-containing protein [Candidatus Paceibacterota bacterium]
MMISKLHDILARVGLTDSEIEIYVATLETGPSKASVIARKARLGRALSYHILESLIKIGLVSVAGTRGKQIFTPEPIDRLKTNLSIKQKDLEILSLDIENLSLELHDLTTKTKVPASIKFLEGLDEMKNAAWNILECRGDELRVIVPTNNVFDLFGEQFVKNWFEEREARKLRSKSIWSYDITEKYKYSDSSFRELKIAPAELKIASTIVLCDSRVIIFSSPATKFGFLVDSEEFSQTMSSMFDNIWSKI